MTPTNLTECLQWIEEAINFRIGPAHAAWSKAGFPDRFTEFVARKVADFLRSHLAQSPLREAPAPQEPSPAALALAREDLGRCMRLAGMQGLVSKEEFEKLRTRIVYAIASVPKPQAEAAPALTWTREKPKVEGWYCWRPVGGGGLAVAEVRMFTGAPCWHSNERKAWVAVWPGLEWAGPVIPKDSDLEDEA